MISTVLVDHPWLTTAAFAALVLVGPVVGAWLATRPRAAYALAGLALLPAVVLTLVPTSREVPFGCTVEWTWPTFAAVEVMANVVLLVAPVLFLAVATRRPLPAVVAGSAVSLAVETAQGITLVAGRSCSTNDWVMNTLGAVLGAVLATVALAVDRLWSGRRPVRVPDGEDRRVPAP
ncbi:hypothetical protein GCM10023339_19060 [Alloalcanivorax gelatiniphagus]